MNERYDYIIVGAGSAGCVMANRLSADLGASVLLIESGPDHTSPLIAMPRGIGKLLIPGNPHIWDYEASRGEGMADELWMKGKAIGGSSSVNGMVYVRGTPADYDAWELQGCSGWGWRDMGRQFVALEDHQLGESQWRGVGGPLKVTVHPPGDALCDAIISAAANIGTPTVADINHVDSVSQGGFGYQPRTTWKGQRFSAAKAFLNPVRSRPNLTVMTDTDVQRIEFDGRRAVAVHTHNKSGAKRIGASREILLCAGAIESPKLLQLSGIGPAGLLQSLGIPVVQDAPDVGRNLREHVYIAAQFRVTCGSFNHCFAGLGLARSVLRYFLFKEGPMTHAAHEAGGFVKTRPGLEQPDAQIGVSLYSMDGDGKTVAIDKQPGLTLGGYFMHPQSQGEIRIQSADPAVPPKIIANYLSSEVDQAAAIALLKWIRKLAAQPSLKPFIVEELTPGLQVQTDDEMLAAFRRYGQTAFHVAGTCRMGTDADAVLDPELRVRGVDGLRVIDTSIMPSLISGNTNAPAMAIAMRAAEIITGMSQQGANAA
ncbi:GMC family oxidoreductase [Halopseudomonas formosensis]|uniref:GMC family oxidoreductase N-terminal domain-containing protein n=1 Tax=Halopseudomonas formosensis TaxID=1002526 RepID=A0ABU5C0X9_9GAMM|nr:GMC family oxidoreductase N-terminal domain-containing protein [Halopseudomonas formosensis]MDX9688487.1 GMC family oxidoreductase N-terminal domain-containing protein [Halopseudomonas formosensis]